MMMMMMMKHPATTTVVTTIIQEQHNSCDWKKQLIMTNYDKIKSKINSRNA
jgi:hypothetical protein